MKLVLIHLSDTAGHPPLGLAYIASYLRKYFNFNNTVIIDKEKDILKKISKEKPDIIGISAVSLQFKRANELAGKIKTLYDTPTLIGGPHITALPHQLGNFNVAVLGEGEQTVLELAELFERKGSFEPEDLKKIKGIAFHDGLSTKITEKRPFIENLDNIPFPARDLLKMKEYYLQPRRTAGGNFVVGTHMFSSRGCPYRCTFCSTANFWQRLRLFSPEYVVNEMKELIRNYNLEAIYVYDDLFVISKERLEKIYELMRAEDIKVKLYCQCRVDRINDDICKILKKMGIDGISFGFESASQKILSYLKKNTTTVEQNKKAIELCNKYEISAEGTMMLGVPGESEEDLDLNLRFVRENELKNIFIYVTTPYPGTELWDYAVKKGIVNDNNVDWSKIDINLSGPLKNKIYMNSDNMDIKRFEEYRHVFKKEMERINLKHSKISIRNLFSLGLLRRAAKDPIQAAKFLYNKT